MERTLETIKTLMAIQNLIFLVAVKRLFFLSYSPVVS